MKSWIIQWRQLQTASQLSLWCNNNIIHLFLLFAVTQRSAYLQNELVFNSCQWHTLCFHMTFIELGIPPCSQYWWFFFWPQGNSGWHSSRLVLLATEETAARQRGSCQHELRGQIVVQVGGRPNRCWCGAWGRLRHSSEVAPHHRHTPTTTKGAGLPAMWTQEKVCELLPRPVQSIIQQMEHINHSEGRADWAGSSRVGGGGRWTPHTDFLCARGRALQYYSDLGGVRVGGGGWNGWSQIGVTDLNIGLFTLWSAWIFKVSPACQILLSDYIYMISKNFSAIIFFSYMQM